MKYLRVFFEDIGAYLNFQPLYNAYCTDWCWYRCTLPRRTLRRLSTGTMSWRSTKQMILRDTAILERHVNNLERLYSNLTEYL